MCIRDRPRPVAAVPAPGPAAPAWRLPRRPPGRRPGTWPAPCLLYTSDAADERFSVDLGGRRIIKKKTTTLSGWAVYLRNTMKVDNR